MHVVAEIHKKLGYFLAGTTLTWIDKLKDTIFCCTL